MSKPRLFDAAYKFAPSIKSAIFSRGSNISIFLLLPQCLFIQSDRAKNDVRRRECLNIKRFFGFMNRVRTLDLNQCNSRRKCEFSQDFFNKGINEAFFSNFSPANIFRKHKIAMLPVG